MKNGITLVLALSLCKILSAQSLLIPPAVQAGLDACGIELFLPQEGQYKALPLPEEPFQPYHFAFRSNRDNLEVRIEFLPKMGDPPIAQVHSYRTALHIGDNLLNTNFTARELTEYERDDVFCADWGGVYILKPKAIFSMQQYCRYMVIHRQGYGMVGVYFLFDKPSEAIDRQMHLIRYKESTW
jgi:hypothetical protein